MGNKKWTDSDLKTAFEDGCKFVDFVDLQDFLLNRRQNAKNEKSNCNILHVGKQSEQCCSKPKPRNYITDMFEPYTMCDNCGKEIL
jgi:hypothetical protein